MCSARHEVTSVYLPSYVFSCNHWKMSFPEIHERHFISRMMFLNFLIFWLMWEMCECYHSFCCGDLSMTVRDFDWSVPIDKSVWVHSPRKGLVSSWRNGVNIGNGVNYWSCLLEGLHKIPDVQGLMSFQASKHLHLEGSTSQLHGGRSSCTRNPPDLPLCISLLTVHLYPFSYLLMYQNA